MKGFINSSLGQRLDVGLAGFFSAVWGAILVVLAVGAAGVYGEVVHLSFPLNSGQFTNAWTAPITSVFDHSMQERFCSNGIVTAYTGETGTVLDPNEPPAGGSGTCAGQALYSYKKADGSAFLINGHYVGTAATGPGTLNYDGHPGYDYPVTTETPVYAVAAGVVLNAVGTDSGPSGKYIQIEHTNTYYLSQYLHLSRVDVMNGQPVQRGELIGLSGSSGGVSPHLHFETKVKIGGNWVSVDPYGWRGSGADPYTPATNVCLWGEVIANVMSPVVSYQYPNDLGSEALTNGGVLSPIASYQYFEWPGDDVLHLDSSRWVSYYYQYLNALLFTVVPTERWPEMRETTPAVLYPLPTESQLKTFEGGVFTGTPVFQPDLSKKSVVLTHGWNSDPDEWAKGMAALMVSKMGAASPNIFAWDWTDAARSGFCDPGTPEGRTADEGLVLGQALLAKLGSDYAQPVHFVGHSLGTLVNAAAADYLHTTSAKSAGAFTPAKTHVTLFDEAEIAKDVHCAQFVMKIIQLLAKGDPLAPKTASDHPLPNDFGWADNYVSAFGVFHEKAANVLLTNGLPTSAPDVGTLIEAISEFHGYPCRWYGTSISDPGGSSALMGFRRSFEQDGLDPAPEVRTAFVQALGGSELDVVKGDYDEVNGMLKERVAKFRSAVYSTVSEVVEDTMTGHGQVTADMLTVGPPAGSGAAIMNWVVNLFGGGGGSKRGSQPKDAGGGTNAPACAWIPLVVPSDAVAMSFDFKVQGNWNEDYVVAALNGTNCLSLTGGRLETNVLFSSGPIEVVAMAGRTNEFFVGIVGGTSSDAQLTVQDVWFYSVALPSLQTGANGSVLSVSWPLSGQDFELQCTTNLADGGSWAVVTNAPAIVDLQHMVTNAISGGNMFYRLRKL